MEGIYKLTTPQILDIEQEINSVLFDGVKIGGLFVDALFDKLLFNNYTPEPKKLLTSFLLYSKHKNKSHNRSENFSIPDNIKYIYYYSSNSHRFLEFYTPLFKYFPKNEISFAGGRENDKYFDDYFYYYYQGLSESLEKEWKHLFNDFQKPFRNLIKKLGIKYKLPASIRYTLYLTAIVQTKKMVYFQHYFKTCSVKALLVDHDRNSTASVMVLAANRTGIKTYTLIHGSTYPGDNFYPLLANYMFCWSYAQKQQMIGFGISVDKLLVTGNQKLSRVFTIEKGSTKEKFKLPEDKKIVLITTTPIKLEERFQFVQDVCSVLNADNYFIIVRIHPVENKQDYEKLTTFNNVVIVNNRDQTLDESLICADILITHKSVVLMEALVKDALTIIYAPEYITAPLGIAEEAVKADAVLLARNTNELLSRINSLSNAQVVCDLQGHSQKYVGEFCSYFNDDAASKVANYLKA